MFELVRTYETAKREPNKFLRYFYLKYTKKKLKKVFFEKFDINRIQLNKDLLTEFLQVYNFIEFKGGTYTNDKYPFIFLADPQSEWIEIRYHGFAINVEILNDNEYNVSILFTPRHSNTVTISPDTNYLNLTMFRPIILMTIYNYCVSYIYGYKSDLYIDDKQYINRLYDVYI